MTSEFRPVARIDRGQYELRELVVARTCGTTNIDALLGMNVAVFPPCVVDRLLAHRHGDRVALRIGSRFGDLWLDADSANITKALDAFVAGKAP